ncbi:MAG: hypothetical protein CMB80_34745 [Flammeovirgaceae bacterium]|nr:hypothetical protein [Flammeovirgaceae bacterium]
MTRIIELECQKSTADGKLRVMLTNQYTNIVFNITDSVRIELIGMLERAGDSNNDYPYFDSRVVKSKNKKE